MHRKLLIGGDQTDLFYFFVETLQDSKASRVMGSDAVVASTCRFGHSMFPVEKSRPCRVILDDQSR